MINTPSWLSPKHTPIRIWTARAIAVLADAVQLALFPFFVEGGISPVNDALDVVVAVLMIWLLGWSWAFLPTFVAEVVPFAALVPSWTAAVLFVTRKGATPTTGPSGDPTRKFVPSVTTESKAASGSPSAQPQR